MVKKSRPDSNVTQRVSFTLIELLLVILVIGAILGMALFRMDGIFPNTRIKQASSRAADMMELASIQAAVEGVPLELVFESETRRILLRRLIDEDSDDEILDEEESTLYWQSWSPQVEIDELMVDDVDGEPVNAESIVFLPEGSCDGALLRWRDETGLTQELELWPLLSKVIVHPVDGSAAY